MGKGENMKRLVGIFLLGAFVLGSSVISMAQTPVVNRREHRQVHRIRHGIRDGELTRREAARLGAEQARIRGYERYARSDGRVTFRERRRLDHMLDRSNRNIYRQTHDRQDRD